MRSAARSATATMTAVGCPETCVGNALASHTRKPSTPCTLRRLSTTLVLGLLPIRALEVCDSELEPREIGYVEEGKHTGCPVDWPWSLVHASRSSSETLCLGKKQKKKRKWEEGTYGIRVAVRRPEQGGFVFGVLGQIQRVNKGLGPRDAHQEAHAHDAQCGVACIGEIAVWCKISIICTIVRRKRTWRRCWGSPKGWRW